MNRVQKLIDVAISQATLRIPQLSYRILCPNIARRHTMRMLVGDIMENQLRYVDCFLSENHLIRQPSCWPIQVIS